MLAFSAQYDGNTDVYVVSIEGGEPARLTWHPAPDNVVGWTPDGARVLFRSARTTAPTPFPNFRTSCRCRAASPAPSRATGSRFAYQQIALNDAEWRSYRGGQTQPVWIVDTDDYALEEVPWDNTNDLDPVWLGDEVYFLSDRDWAMNLHAYDPATGAVRQVTRHADFDVKSVDAGGGVLVYQQGGYIHLHDPASGATDRVDISVRGDFPWLRTHWEEVGGALQNASLSPTGGPGALRGHRSDLNYLLDILGGEVAIGHSFVFGGDNPDVDNVPIGLLGADLEEDQGRYRIAHVYTGENWNPGLQSPLSAPGIDVAEGDYIIAVDGVELRAPTNPYSLFEGTVGRQVALSVNDGPREEGSRVVRVVPVGNESALRSREWVEDNRRKVDELSGGRLAYVWLPNTAQGGYTYFNRYYFAQQHKQGAVVDRALPTGAVRPRTTSSTS